MDRWPRSPKRCGSWAVCNWVSRCPTPRSARSWRSSTRSPDLSPRILLRHRPSLPPPQSSAGRESARSLIRSNGHVVPDEGLRRRSARALLHEHPFGLEEWERNESNDRRRGHQPGVAHLPPEKHQEAPKRDQRGEPVSDGDLPQQHAGTQDGADGRGIGAFDEALDIRILTVAHQNWRDDENEQEGGEEDTDRSRDGAPQAIEQGAAQPRRHEVADEGRRDDDGPRANHAHGHRDEEIAFVQPVHLLHETLLQEWHDDEAAAEGQRAGLEEESQQLAEDLADAGRRRADAGQGQAKE